ncbi:hypothetical protein BGP78_14285 [Pseudoalteromonas sp. MSK9-3]|nr:hypothetical protein BGP78_14285 [Pseudoalteromonas sp. MSK9-3]
MLDVISVVLIFGPLWHSAIVTPLYLSLLGICALYGIYRKDINTTHIACFILFITTLNWAFFETSLINYVTPDENKVLQGILIYGAQLLFSFSITLTLIFRVQISRLISKSKKISITHFDGIFHWLYLYSSMIYLLAMFEDVAYFAFEMKSWTLIHENFEGLVYISWALSSATLLNMIIATKEFSQDNEETASK